MGNAPFKAMGEKERRPFEIFFPNKILGRHGGNEKRSAMYYGPKEVKITQQKKKGFYAFPCSVCVCDAYE
jgi:hypothetical protein